MGFSWDESALPILISTWFFGSISDLLNANNASITVLGILIPGACLVCKINNAFTSRGLFLSSLKQITWLIILLGDHTTARVSNHPVHLKCEWIAVRMATGCRWHDSLTPGSLIPYRYHRDIHTLQVQVLGNALFNCKCIPYVHFG